VGIIKKRCSDLLTIINDMLDIAKIESGELPVNLEECDLNELLTEISLQFTKEQRQIEKQLIKFTIHTITAPEENTIMGDKGKLKQIFINLINNAFKFTDQGEIEVGYKFDEKHALIFYVSDTGVGIPMEKQKIIFEPFTQLHLGTKSFTDGTGLGLSIVKGLVTLLGGEIWVESEPGKGSVFSFSIPFNQTSPSNHPPKINEEHHKYCFPDKNILIVEDDIYNAEFLKEVLTETGVNIFCAENGSEAIEIVFARDLDLVLIDVRLPDINGYDAARLIKQFKPDLPIIAQTAYASYGEKQKAFEAGCIDYLSKPTDSNTLLAMVNKHLTK